MSNDWSDAWEEPFTLAVFADDNYARVELSDVCGNVVAKGVSRRDPADLPDREIGIELATARAFASYANKKNRRAKGLIKHADEVRSSKETAKFVRAYNTPGDRDPYYTVPLSLRPSYNWLRA